MRRKAVRRRIEGDVLLNVRISPAGFIDNVESARGEPLLVQATRLAVSSWRFTPRPGTPATTAHVPVGIQFRLDLDLPDLLERAQGLTVTRRVPGSDSIRATAEVASADTRAKIARALTAGGFLSKTGRGATDPKGADWGLSWRTQGRVIEMRFAEEPHRLVVTDEGRKWAGDNGKKARALADELHAVIP